METKTLEQILKDTIKDLKNKKVNERIIAYTNYDNSYALLKNKMIVTVDLQKEGIRAEIDITDLFKESL